MNFLNGWDKFISGIMISLVFFTIYCLVMPPAHAAIDDNVSTCKVVPASKI